MNIRWRKLAETQLNSISTYYVQNFGVRAANNLLDKVEQKLKRLADNPELGFPEPLLAEHKRNYRSLIVDEHYKIIYWTDAAQGIIYIADLWDTRREPARLAKRMK